MQEIILTNKNYTEVIDVINEFLTQNKVVLEGFHSKSIFLGYCNQHPLNKNPNSSAILAIFNKFFKFPCLPLSEGTKIRINEDELFLEGKFIGHLFFKKESYTDAH